MRILEQWQGGCLPYAANDVLALRNCNRLSHWQFQQRVFRLKRFSRLSSLTATEKPLQPPTSPPSFSAGMLIINPPDILAPCHPNNCFAAVIQLTRHHDSVTTSVEHSIVIAS